MSETPFKDRDFCPYCGATRIMFLDEVELGKYLPETETKSINASFACGSYVYEGERIRQSIHCVVKQRDNLNSEMFFLTRRVEKLEDRITNLKMPSTITIGCGPGGGVGMGGGASFGGNGLTPRDCLCPCIDKGKDI